jgi:hypothetical protein
MVYKTLRDEECGKTVFYRFLLGFNSLRVLPGGSASQAAIRPFDGRIPIR